MGNEGIGADGASRRWRFRQWRLEKVPPMVLAVKEIVGKGLGQGLAEAELASAPLICPAVEARNVTLRKLHEAIDLCASPYFRLPTIHPSQLVWTDVDPSKDKISGD
ncbi:unnamed protein product, partial [Choristocarpus tenellus]